MLSTKNLVRDDVEIPSNWVFEYYLNLPEKLVGQDVKIKSIWNDERTPSMSIYVDNKTNEYRYKDFSSGNSGSKVDLVRELHDEVSNYSEAVFKMVSDFNKFILNNDSYKQSKFIKQSRFKVVFAKPRMWNINDRNFWLQYGIGTSILFEYNVKPLEYYTMSKESGDKIQNIKIKNPRIYGYYDKEGNIYKIYQPNQKEHKFIKISHYIQGLDQLKYDKPCLIITSSLKDIMSLRHFNYNIEYIAPDSENTIIKPYIINNLKGKYKKIITLFDNDIAGKKAIDKYKLHFNIDGVHPTIDNDPSDSIKNHGFKKTHNDLKLLLKKII